MVGYQFWSDGEFCCFFFYQIDVVIDFDVSNGIVNFSDDEMGKVFYGLIWFQLIDMVVQNDFQIGFYG